MLVEIPKLSDYALALAEHKSKVDEEASRIVANRKEMEEWKKKSKEEKAAGAAPLKHKKKSLPPPKLEFDIRNACDYCYKLSDMYVSASSSGKIPELCAGQFCSRQCLESMFLLRCIPSRSVVAGDSKVTPSKRASAAAFLLDHGYPVDSDAEPHEVPCEKLQGEVGKDVMVPTAAKLKSQNKPKIVTKVEQMIEERAMLFPVREDATPIPFTYTRDKVFDHIVNRVGKEGVFKLEDIKLPSGESSRNVRFSQDAQLVGHSESCLSSGFPVNQNHQEGENLVPLGEVLYVHYSYPTRKGSKRKARSEKPDPGRVFASPEKEDEAPAAKKQKECQQEDTQPESSEPSESA